MLGTMIFSVREKIAIIKSSNLSRNSVILNLNWKYQTELIYF